MIKNGVTNNVHKQNKQMQDIEMPEGNVIIRKDYNIAGAGREVKCETAFSSTFSATPFSYLLLAPHLKSLIMKSPNLD